MTGREPSAGMLPVDRVEMAIRDLDAIAELMSQLYAEHRHRFRCADPGRVDGLFQSVTAGPLRTVVNRWSGFDYGADISPVGYLLAWASALFYCGGLFCLAVLPHGVAVPRWLIFAYGVGCALLALLAPAVTSLGRKGDRQPVSARSKDVAGGAAGDGRSVRCTRRRSWRA